MRYGSRSGRQRSVGPRNARGTLTPQLREKGLASKTYPGGSAATSEVITIITSVDIAAESGTIWRVLCDARLPLTAPCWFRLGVPTPEKCAIVSESGGVGAGRHCTTNRGTINQRIIEWEESRRLAFEWVDDTVGLGSYLNHMRDTFTLEPLEPGRTRLVRRTEYEPKNTVGWLRRTILRLTVKRIHRFVMRNFKAICEGP